MEWVRMIMLLGTQQKFILTDREIEKFTRNIIAYPALRRHYLCALVLGIPY